MSYDALVWLLVGLGVGVAGSLMLLMGYAGLERGRLARRLRKARAAVAMAAEAKPAPVVRPPGSKLGMAGPAAVKPAPDESRPTPEIPAPVVVAAAPEPVVPVGPAANAVDAEVETPVAAAPAPAAAPAGPRPVQSVEAMFAEAFANDKLPAPEPDEKTS